MTAVVSGLSQAWIDAQIDAGATLLEAQSAAFTAIQARSAALAGIRVTISTGGAGPSERASIAA
jgi:hypothetical protein